MIEVLDIDDDVFAPSLPAPSSGWTYRDYQRRCFDAIDDAWLAGLRSVIIVLATGLGKTVVFSYVAKKITERGGKVLILAHSEELLDQAAEKLLDSTGVEAAKEKANDRATPWDSIVLASVQTLSRKTRLDGWAPDHFELIITDECHRGMAKSYRTIYDHFTGAKKLGVTATADRGDGQALGEIYEKCVFEFGLLEAVRAGWLVRPIVRTMPLEIDLKGVKTSRTSQGADYDLGEVSHRITPFLGEIARLMAENTKGRKQGVVFMPSVETARMMRDALLNAGMNAEYVSGECPDRTEKIERFKAGEIQVLINAMLLIEGFDHDAVDWICVLRPTKIRALYVQAAGRGTRPLKSIIKALNAAGSDEERREIIAKSEKPTLLILDFLWLTEKLDLIAPVSLVCKDPRVAEMAAKKAKDGDLLEIEASAQRDLLKSLEKAAAKNAGKKGKTLDPLALAVSLKTEDLSHYEPKEKWEFGAPSVAQLEVLAKNRIDISKVHTAGMASQILNRLHLRRQQGLCSVGQMQFLEKLGIKDAALKTAAEAKAITLRQLSDWKNRRR